MLACGTSFHSALIGKYIGERLTDISIKAELASELNYYHSLQYVPVTVGITQSGETADTLKAMRRLKEGGSKVVAITNVPGSTASRIADYTIYLNAGPEISVAATKSFTAQLTALYYLSLMYSRVEARTYNDLIMDLRLLPDQIQRLFTLEDLIASHSCKLANYEYVIFIGRGINYAIAMEGALKLKEVSYIHSEAYAAGEIKHGPFALLSRDTPVVAIVANDSSYDAMLTNIKEIKSRGSPVFAIVNEKDDIVQDIADYVIPVPSTSDLTSPFINAVVIQLIAYYSAKKRLCPIDFPRNLAKSVTVE
jgi:glucosamine--fructose-6-phosphate aminotransferase (isomerizing)